MKPCVLVVDIGNTSTTLGLYRHRRVFKTDRLERADATPATVRKKLRHLAGGHRVDGVVLSSVVPGVTGTWAAGCRAEAPRAQMIRVDHRLELGVPVTYPRPETIGADRLANACGAAARYGTPVIVADFGTALTFDIISAEGGYIGGVIAPGLPLMFSYLAEKTALLPHIQPGRARHRVGKSTREAMQLGARWGYRGLVREIVAEIGKMFGRRPVKLCATGGYAGWVLRGSGIKIRIDPDLTLFGLGRIFDLNAR
jgi:type III pantothenate kinase